LWELIGAGTPPHTAQAPWDNPLVPAPLSIPDLVWRNGALFSRAHDDCYTPALATFGNTAAQ
jgi:hypothetical protein